MQLWRPLFALCMTFLCRRTNYLSNDGWHVHILHFFFHPRMVNQLCPDAQPIIVRMQYARRGAPRVKQESQNQTGHSKLLLCRSLSRAYV
jgi:hypothetical protein